MPGVVKFWRENAWILGIFARVMFPGVISGILAVVTLEYFSSSPLAVVVMVVSLFFLTPPFVDDAVRRTNERFNKTQEDIKESLEVDVLPTIQHKDGDDANKSQTNPETKELDELLDKFRKYGPEALTCNELMRLKYLLERYKPMDERTLSLAFYAVGMLVGYRCFKS